MNEYQQLSVEQSGEFAVVRFRQPRISGVWETERLSQELYQLVEKESHAKLVLDFSTVEFLSSQVFGTLVALNGKTKARNGVLRLCNIQPKVLDVLLTCKLDQLFDIRPDLSSSLTPS